MTEVKKFFIYWPGKHYLGSGGQFQQNIHREIHRGTSHWGAWTECVNLREFKSRKSKTKMASDKVFFKISATDSKQDFWVLYKSHLISSWPRTISSISSPPILKDWPGCNEFLRWFSNHVIELMQTSKNYYFAPCK